MLHFIYLISFIYNYFLPFKKDGTGYEDKTNYDSFNVRREGYFFADEIKVDGETIFTIPFEK